MKLSVTNPQEFIVTPSITAGEDKPFSIKFREPLATDTNLFFKNVNDFYVELLYKCFVEFENKIEIEKDGEPFNYFNYEQFVNAGDCAEIRGIHTECLSKMIEVFNEQQENRKTLEKKSESAGSSTSPATSPTTKAKKTD